MTFEDFDIDEKIEALRSDIDQIMRHLDIRSEYVSRTEIAERVELFKANTERKKVRATIIKQIVKNKENV